MRFIITVGVAGLSVLAGLHGSEIAPASAQYRLDGTTPAASAKPAEAALFSRKIWPKVELADGRVFEKVRVTAEDGATVTLMHSGGIAKVDKRALPEELAAQHPYVAGSAQVAADQAATRRQAAAETPPPVKKIPAPTRPRPITPAPDPNPHYSTGLTEDIERAVRARARRYFQTEKRIGSGQTLAFSVLSEMSEPKEVPGWANRWEVSGTAGYRVYESVGWGSFSTRTTKFHAIVETPPGKKIVVTSFEERS